MTILITNFIFFVCLYCFVFNNKSIKNKNGVFFIISVFVLTLTHGLIDTNSVPDVPLYESTFNKYKTAPFSEVFQQGDETIGDNFEIGFQLILGIVSRLCGSFTVFMLIYSFLLCYSFLNLARNYSPLFGISVLLFLLLPYNQSLFVIRQYLSLSVLLFSVKYILERRLVPFVIIVVIATLIHTSSIVFLPVYFLYLIKNKKMLFFFLALFLLAIFELKPIIDSLSTILDGNRYEGYIEGVSLHAATKGIIMALMTFAYIVVLKGRVFDDGINRLVFVIGLAGTLLNLIMGESGAGRIFLSYYFILLIQIPVIASHLKSKSVKNIFLFFTIALLFYFSFYLSADIESASGVRYLFL